MSKSSKTTTRVLVVGAGRFGKEHLDTWQRLAAEGLACVGGIVVKTPDSRERLAGSYQVPIHVGFQPSLLEEVDAVDIVSPAETHYELVRQAYPKVHVLVEKPLGISQRELRVLARDSARGGRVLMVNHLYRFHPVLKALRKLMKSVPGRPLLISGTFVNPLEPGVDKLSPNLELLHYFDILDALFQGRPCAVWSQQSEFVNQVSLRYANGMNVVLELGWRGASRIRTLELHYPERKLSADFGDGVVELEQLDRYEKYTVPEGLRPLETSLRCFLQAIRNRRVRYPDAQLGARVAQVALRTVPGPRKVRPNAIVIGGGLFGAACALEIARHCDVLIAERHPQLLIEASWNNQVRHHSGFHYPRSAATVQEIRATRRTFDAEFGDCIVQEGESYYCTAASAREITAERYLAFCKAHQLNYVQDNPPPGILDQSRVSLCLRTDEQVLDLAKLRSMLQERLSSNARIKLQLNTAVTGGRLDHAGRKVMRLESGGKTVRESFDYLINASYANSNLVSKWFGFPTRPLRFDLIEIMTLEVSIPKVSVTIMDAPFMSMMSMGEDGMFLACQVPDGVLRSAVAADGLPPAWEPYPSNRHVMLRHMSEYLPALREARYLDSRYGIRTVLAFHEDYDGRPTVVTRHGFGCWSVLGGKLCACVSSAREITREMFPDAELQYEFDAAVSEECVPA